MSNYVETISRDPSVQARYEAMIADGQSPRLAEMLATRSFPGLKGTDASFMQGRQTDGAQFDGSPDIVGKDYVRKAEAAGVNPSGKWYSSSLARFPGDPKAWVNGLGDVKRRCEEEGWGCRGAVSVTEKPSEYVAPDKYKVDPSIIAREVGEIIAENPERARDIEGLTHEVASVRAGIKGA